MKTPPHIPVTGVQCSGCHKNTDASFLTYTMVATGHASVSSTPCSTCHSGSYTSEGKTGALGLTTAHIPVGTAQCSSCHSNSASSFATYTMGATGHASVSSTSCSTCHNGSYISQGTTGAQGTASFPNHVATFGADCKTCHASAASAFTSWAGGAHVHAATDTNCSSCHNGTTATGMKTPPHIPVTAIQCSNCHNNTAASFTTYTMNHTSVSTSRCDSCHNGSYASQGTKGAQGTASFAGHVATNGSDCVTCHASAASGFTSWAGGKFAHAAADTNCSNCHNGTTATGMTTPPHIPVTAIQCSNCHANTAASFTTYTMSHTAVTSSRCDSCHNGSYTSQGTQGARGKSSDHPKTTADCGCCHTSTTSFDQRRSSPSGCSTTATAAAVAAPAAVAPVTAAKTAVTTTTAAPTAAPAVAPLAAATKSGAALTTSA